jgi:hypothetical protein
VIHDCGGRLDAGPSIDESVDGLLASMGADLPYFTGYQAMPLERLTLLAIHGC